MDDLKLALAAYWYQANNYSDASSRLRERFPGASDRDISDALAGGRALVQSGEHVSGYQSEWSDKRFRDLDLPEYGRGSTVQIKLRYRYGPGFGDWSTIAASFDASETLENITDMVKRDIAGQLDKKSSPKPSDAQLREIVIEYAYRR